VTRPAADGSVAMLANALNCLGGAIKVAVMKLLILGGTRFLGRHVAAQALARGHQLTLLHRGRSGPAVFPEAQHLLSDRDGDLSVLGDGTWDAAVDTSAYFPRQVRAVAAKLAGRVGHYHLVSSISAYADFENGGSIESAPLASLLDPTVEVVNGETYGGLKALCEQAAQAAFGERCLISRPGLIVGPFDPTGRFTWWVQRLARGGDVLAPGRPESPVQFIDVRDIAAWTLLQAERAHAGVYNLNGPSQALTMGAFLQTAQQVLQPGAKLVWVDEAFLQAQGVAAWSDLPVWLPTDSFAMHRTPTARAQASGLMCRPLPETLQDTLAWCQTAQDPARPGVGLTADREASLLAAWRSKT
jgi:2'-hydroxyisoflavone reductase